MRSSARICGFLAAFLLAVLFAPLARASGSDQGVEIGSLAHWFGYQRAALLHDVSGAYFVWLPYFYFEGGALFHLDAAQADPWETEALFPQGRSTFYANSAVALDGSGGLFFFNWDGYYGITNQLHHLLPNGTEDWGTPAYQFNSDCGCGLDLVADGSGGAWGVWMVVLQSGQGGATPGLRLQHWLAGGSVAPGWDPAGRLIPNAWFPALARDGSGGVLLFFESMDGRARVTRVQADTTIAPGWTEAGLDLGPDNSFDGFRTLLLRSGDSGWIAIWGGDSGNATRAFAQRFLAGGTLDPAWAGGAPLAMVTYAGHTGPDTFSDGAGGFHHVWADTATGVPRWLHVTASGGYATGFGWNGIPVLRPGDGFNSSAYPANFVAAPSDNGGIVLAWDDVGAGRAPAVRVRWLMPDGTNDPAAPDTGRAIPGTDAHSHIWGLDADGAGGVWTLWSNPGSESPVSIFLMNHMARSPAVADVPPSGRATTLALSAPRPTPTRGAFDVRCTLASEAPATLSLFDLSGRRLRDVTLQGAGDHIAHLDPPRGLPPGIYLLRLTQGPESRTARAVVIH